MSPFPPVCFDCDKTIAMNRYQIGICTQCEKERAMDELTQVIKAKNSPQAQVEAAAKALKHYERALHRPNQMIFLALALGVIAGILAVGCTQIAEDYFTTLHETQTGSLLP